eukprot:Rhum_TRINITY_DN19019_c0_g1::Rhum_TRINITY_DN19019_c0_g1_i1::g.169059::m.169059
MSWVEKHCNGERYYYNPTTGQASVDTPEGFVPATGEHANVEAIVTEALDSGKWVAQTTASGKTYYIDKETKRATWDLRRTLEEGSSIAAKPATGAAAKVVREESPALPVDTERRDDGALNVLLQPTHKKTLTDEEHIAITVLANQNVADRTLVTYMTRELAHLQEVAPDSVLEKTQDERLSALRQAKAGIKEIKDGIGEYGHIRHEPVSPPAEHTHEAPYASPRFFPEGNLSNPHACFHRSTSPQRTQARRLLDAAEKMPAPQAQPAATRSLDGHVLPFPALGDRLPLSSDVPPCAAPLAGWSAVEADAWAQLAELGAD